MMVLSALVANRLYSASVFIIMGNIYDLSSSYYHSYNYSYSFMLKNMKNCKLKQSSNYCLIFISDK